MILREAFTTLVEHKGGLSQFSRNELETLIFKLEVELHERIQTNTYDYNQDTE